MSKKDTVTRILRKAGIEVNGPHDFDIQVKDETFYKDALRRGSIGVGEAYMLGKWTCKDLAGFFTKVLSTGNIYREAIDPLLIWNALLGQVLNLQTIHRSKRVGKEHYDLGNDFYKDMLGESMTYTCAYWKDATNLFDAQMAKYELICRKVGLKKGERILDIGCGWGGFAKYAAEKFGASVVGVTISKEQAAYAAEACKDFDVDIRLQDYRHIEDGPFDHIISIGMFEHVGKRNYSAYFEKVYDLLAPNGVFLLHTIGKTKPTFATDPWITKYIFPGGELPAPQDIAVHFSGYSFVRFVLEDWHNFGRDYAKTLRAWNDNFQKSWPRYEKKYGEVFKRMWEYYLLACAGAFEARSIHLFQIALRKPGNLPEYRSVR